MFKKPPIFSAVRSAQNEIDFSQLVFLLKTSQDQWALSFDRAFAGILDRPSFWVGVAQNTLESLSGSIASSGATRQSLELCAGVSIACPSTREREKAERELSAFSIFTTSIRNQ